EMTSWPPGPNHTGRTSTASFSAVSGREPLAPCRNSCAEPKTKNNQENERKLMNDKFHHLAKSLAQSVRREVSLAKLTRFPALGARTLTGLYTHLARPKEGIPKGFRPKAQGCEERATLGRNRGRDSTLKGLRPIVSTCCSQ